MPCFADCRFCSGGPAAAGSPAEALELAQLHQLIKGTSAARMEQARYDDAHEDPAIFDGVVGYALSREICGVHFPSDTEASHVIGTLVAATILADRRVQPRIAAARAELGELASR